MKIAVSTLDLYSVPVGLGIIVRMLLERRFDVKVFNIHDMPAALKDAAEFRPDIVIASLFSGSHGRHIDFIRSLKAATPCLSIVGGPHCTFSPEVIDQNPCLDVLCRGEGEHPMTMFFDAYRAGSALPVNIPNLFVRSGNTIVKNDFEPLEENLDKFPFAERRVFYEAYPHMKTFPVEIFITSRGCPFHCTYCFNNKMFKFFGGSWGKVRYRSPDNVVREIEDVMSHKKLEFIEFHDDMFGLNRDWLEEFKTLYRERIGLPFRCNIIPYYIDEAYVKRLSEANLRAGSIGIQTANERIRGDVLKRKGTNAQIEKSVSILKSHGIRVITDTMLGLPESTIEDDLESLRFNHALGVDYAWASIFTPYPGTELAEYAKEKGLWDGKVDNLPSSILLKSVLAFDENHRRKIFILHAFYSLTVNFYVFRHIVNFLFRFPALGIYKIIPAVTQSLLLNFKVYRTKYMFRNIFSMIPAFLRRTLNRMKNVN